MVTAVSPNGAAPDQFARLVRAINPTATLVTSWPLAGGVSAQTTALDMAWADGARRRVVVRVYSDADVRRDPLIAEHEYQVLTAVGAAGVPVPAPIYADQSGEIFDAPVLVIEFVEGEVISEPPAPARYIADLATWLARIHDIDLASTDLSFLAALNAGIEARQEARDGDPPRVREILDALGGIWPVPSRNAPVLLHGDYWHANLLWKDGELAAIVDWEDAAIGDPLADLARIRLELHWTLGELARERFTSHYQSYRDIDIDALAAWDLAMAVDLARGLPTWGLPEPRERQMQQALGRFVEQAKQQLTIERG